MMEGILLTILMLMIPALVVVMIWRTGAGSKRDRALVTAFLLTLMIATFLPDPLLVYETYAENGDLTPVLASVGAATVLSILAVFVFKAYKRSP